MPQGIYTLFGRKLAGGKAHGLNNGSEFTVYQSRDPLLEGSEPLNIWPASSVDKHLTWLDYDVDYSPHHIQRVAIQTKAGDSNNLQLYIPGESPLLPLFETVQLELPRKSDPSIEIKFVSRDQAQLEIIPTGQGQQFTFNVPSGPIPDFRIPHIVDPDREDLHRILFAAARYYYQLHHVNGEAPWNIDIELFSLREEKSDKVKPVFSPGDSIYREGRINVEVDEGLRYGIRLTNTRYRSLYFACFYFDNADFSISEWSSNWNPQV